MSTAPSAPGPAERITATLRGVASQAAENRPAGIVVSLILALLTDLFARLAELVERIKAGEYQPRPQGPAPAAHQALATAQAARKIPPAARGDACGERRFRAAGYPAPGPGNCGADESHPGPDSKNPPPGPPTLAAPPAGQQAAARQSDDRPGPPPSPPQKSPPQARALARPFHSVYEITKDGRTLWPAGLTPKNTSPSG
jgi:hypothetical protein